MTTRTRIILGVTVSVLAIVVVCACVSVLTGGRYASQIKELNSADIDSEVQDAVARQDNRFVGVMGIGLIVPGVPDYHDKYADKFGVRVIPDTSDVIESDEHMRLQEAAWEYANKYNAALLRKLGLDVKQQGN